MQSANEAPKTPEKTHLTTIGTAVVSVLVGFFLSMPLDKAKRSDNDLFEKVNDLETRLNEVEKKVERSDERMIHVKESVDEIKRIQIQMLDEIRKKK